MDTQKIVDRGMIYTLIFAFIAIAISGMVFAFGYFVMDEVDTAFRSQNCTISNNVLVSSCQELFNLALFPILGLKNVLIWSSFLGIFALVAGLLVLGYQSGTRPTLMGLLVVVQLVFTYGAIEIANIYRTMIENDVLRGMLVEFTVYNKIMLNFPWFVFIVSLFSMALGVVNWQRTSVNNPQNTLDY